MLLLVLLLRSAALVPRAPWTACTEAGPRGVLLYTEYITPRASPSGPFFNNNKRVDRRGLERQQKVFLWIAVLFPSLVLVFQSLSDYDRSGQGQGHVFMPAMCMAGSSIEAPGACSVAFFLGGFLPSGPTRSLDATDHRLG